MKRIILLAVLGLAGCSRLHTAYNGVIDDVNCDNIVGWAMDWARVAESLDVTIFDDQGLMNLRVPARIPRANFSPGVQNHGFTVRVPDALRDGKSHFVHVAFEGTKAELRHSPRPLNCPARDAEKGNSAADERR
jgi:hypothetical protein